MRIRKTDAWLLGMLTLCFVLPLLLGMYFQQFASWRFENLALHATIETLGGFSALIVALMIYLVLGGDKEALNPTHKLALALIAVGVFDIFHAMMPPGNVFVWLHSLSVFSGGILLLLVLLPSVRVGPTAYFVIPSVVLALSITVALISVNIPHQMPFMLNAENEFTDTAKLLNITGGSMYILAALVFIRAYLITFERRILLFAGQAMLLGVAGVYFFFSMIWEVTWWFWHFLRLIALTSLLGYFIWVFKGNSLLIARIRRNTVTRLRQVTKELKASEVRERAFRENTLNFQVAIDGKIESVNPHSLPEAVQDANGKMLWQLFEWNKSAEALKRKILTESQNLKGFSVLLELIDFPTQAKQKRFFQAEFHPVFLPAGSSSVPNPHSWLLVCFEVSDYIFQQQQLKQNFYQDPLTKLPNRFKLNEALQQHSFLHLALVNIDNFKTINDFYGVEFGDAVICKLGELLKASLEKHGYRLFRNHGDEFALLSGYEVPYEMFETHLKLFSEEIEAGSVRVETVTLELQISIGLVESSNSLVKADMALKECKQFHYKYVKYSADLEVERQFQKNIYWSQRIKQALKEDRIQIMLQPILNNHTQKVVKYEALVRLIETTGEVVSPVEFLEVAKRTRLYHAITTRVIKKSFEVLQKIAASVAINLTVEDILNEETKNYLLNLLKTTEYSRYLIIELVESDGIENFAPIKSFIDEVKSFGVRIAIDDFGTGYSNFEYLLKLDADFIKIDGSLIQGIDRGGQNEKVVEAMVSFAHNVNLQVVAEFVSTGSIQEKIIELGIDYSQGYFIDQPRFVEDILSERGQ